jgi:hypothetical protein
MKNIIRVKQLIGLIKEEELNDSVLKVIDKLVDRYYDIKFNYLVADGHISCTLKLIDKPTSKFQDSNIRFYSYYIKKRDGSFSLYDNNSAYNEGGIFRDLGLMRSLNFWLENKTLELLKKNLWKILIKNF